MKRTILYMKILWDITILSMMIDTILFMYSQQKVTLGDFTFITILTTRLFHSIWWFISQTKEVSETLRRCKQALDILNTPYEITDHIHAKSPKVTQGKSPSTTSPSTTKTEKTYFTNKI